MRKFRTNYLIAIAYSSLIFILSLYNFISIEPGIDQIRYISWAKSLNESEYFVNFKYIDNYYLFFFDTKSFFINLFKTCYSDIGNIFNLFPVILLFIVNFLGFSNVETFNTISIIFFSFSIYLTIIIFLEFFQKNSNNVNFPFLYIFFLAFLFNFYTFTFSPLGIHNICVFFLLLTFLNILKFENNKKYFLYLIISSLLGIFSHKIGPTIIIPMVTFFFLIKKNFKKLFQYNLIISIILSPIFLAILLIPSTIEATIYFAEFQPSILIYIKNFFNWFYNIFKTLGPLILILFLIGICRLIKDYKKKYLFAIVLIIHITLSIFINTFTTYYIRTSLYITPFIIILAIFGLEFIWNKYENIFLKTITTILILINLSYNIFIIIDKKFADTNNFEIYRTFYKYNGKLSESLNEILPIIAKEKILFNSNTSEDYFRIYQNQTYILNRPQIKPLRNIKNTDKKYLENFKHERYYLLTISSDEISAKQDFLNLKKKKILFEKCNLDDKQIFKKDKIITGGYNFYVHLIHCKTL